MREEQIKERIKEFLSPEHKIKRKLEFQEKTLFTYWDNLLALANEYPDRKSLEVEFQHILSFDKELAKFLIKQPEFFLREATSAIAEMDLPIDIELKGVAMRIVGLPPDYEIPISQIRHEHAENLVAIVGTINKREPVKATFKKTAFECMRCQFVTVVEQSVDVDKLNEPFAGCESETCGKKGPFKIRVDQSVMYDRQYMIIQEPYENLKGRQPEALLVAATEELTGKYIPGQKVIITGILKLKPIYKKHGERSQSMDWLLVANSIVLSQTEYENLDITEEDISAFEELARSPDLKSKMVNSVAPSIFGRLDVKEGLLLQQFSGVRKIQSDETTVRGDIHAMLIGDPSVAKSQMLEYISILAPRSVMTSGRSASAAGLTGAAVQDSDGKWTIEAGALTMAGEGGTCITDETDKMNRKDRASIHEALEQQRISLAKVGIMMQLPAVCSFLGAANPKNSKFDKTIPLKEQINLDDAFLTRMDLIYIMTDIPNPTRDILIAKHMLYGPSEEEIKNIINVEFLRKYIAYARTNFFPVLDNEANEIILGFYTNTRPLSKKDTISITPRYIRSIQRLTQANARLRLSNVATKQDAESAVELVLSNLREVGIDPETGEFDVNVIDFGSTGRQAKRMKELKDIIQKLASMDISEHKHARVCDVMQKADEAHLKEPMELMKKLVDRGEIQNFPPGYVKVVKK